MTTYICTVYYSAVAANTANFHKKTIKEPHVYLPLVSDNKYDVPLYNKASDSLFNKFNIT